MSYTLPASRTVLPRASARIPRVGALAATVALLSVAAYGLGRAVAPATTTAPAAIQAVGRVPVGVEHSPAGALAAADDYLAVEQATVEQDPALDAQLINTVYAPSIRARELRSAVAARAADPQGMSLWTRGGQNLSGVAARRLDAYTGAQAEVTAWEFNVFWGPGRTPKQGWLLAQTTLRWAGGRWVVAAIGASITPAPAPQITPQASTTNDTAARFGSALTRFAAPIEEVAGR